MVHNTYICDLFCYILNVSHPWVPFIRDSFFIVYAPTVMWIVTALYLTIHIIRQKRKNGTNTVTNTVSSSYGIQFSTHYPSGVDT